MFSSDQLNMMVKEIMARLNGGVDLENTCKKDNKSCDGKAISITPSQALVISGLIGGVFEITSVLVDRNQLVQIVISGSLKKKTHLDKMIDQIGSESFEDVMKALLGKFST